MIDELGEPDEYCDNPHWKSGPPASLYSIERVETWIEENKERVEKARQSRVGRSAASKHVHDKKRAERYEKAKAWVTSLAITVTRPFPNTLLDEARKTLHFQGTPGPFAGEGASRLCAPPPHELRVAVAGVVLPRVSRELYPLLRQRIDAEVVVALAEWKNAQAKP